MRDEIIIHLPTLIHASGNFIIITSSPPLIIITAINAAEITIESSYIVDTEKLSRGIECMKYYFLKLFDTINK